MRRLLVSVSVVLAACGSESGGSVGAFTVDIDPEGRGLSITHPSGLSVSTAAVPFGFRAARATYEMQFGSFLIEDMPLADWDEGARLAGVSTSEAGLQADIEGVDGDKLGRLEVREGPAGLVLRASTNDPAVNRAFLSLACDAPGAGGFIGFGAHTYDVDHRGQVVPIWVSEQGIGKVETNEPGDVWFLTGTRHQSYLAVPTMLAPRAEVSYGLHATTEYRSVWDLCATDPDVLRIEVWEGVAELVISPGPSPLEVVEQQTALNGRIPKAPDWTFGVWMEAIGGEAAVRAEIDRLRAEQIPASAIWTEDWRGAMDLGRSYVLEEDWRWDRALYPNLPDMIEDFEANGLAFMTYFNTFVVEDVDVFAEAREGGHLVLDKRGDLFSFQAPDFETSHLADLFAPGSREWVKGELKDALRLGVKGWMADFAEWYPADPRTVQTSDGRDPEAAHHQYPYEWAVLNREAVEEEGADDVVIFHRSGYSGSQGKAHVVWAGDQRTSFQIDDGLPTIVPILLGLSVTGFPVVTHDIAGYVSATNPPTSKELFFRWTSLGAMAPVMRTHHGRDAQLNWRWSRDAETIAHFKRWADLHTRMFPMWAGLGLDASETGAPILRPLFFHDPADVRLHPVTDAYLVGDALLVAPVVTSSVSSRDVPLPDGTWYGFFDGAVHEGGGIARFDVPLTELVLLARAGAVVPMLPEGVQSLRASSQVLDLDEVRDQREVRVWLGADGAARDSSGGRYELTSPARPVGALRVDGADEVLLEEQGHLRFIASGPSEVTLEGGERHVLRAVDVPAGQRIVYDVIW